MEHVKAVELASMMAQFISGLDRSSKLVGRIEVCVDDAFPDEEEWQELVLALASYQPGGGEYLVAEDQVVSLFRRFLPKVEELTR